MERLRNHGSYLKASRCAWLFVVLRKKWQSRDAVEYVTCSPHARYAGNEIELCMPRR